MCVVSMVSGDWIKRNEPVYPGFFPTPYTNPAPPGGYPTWNPPSVDKREFDALKREVEELRKLLMAAKEYDEKTNQPDCEDADKVKLLLAIADIVGVDLHKVFGKSNG